MDKYFKNKKFAILMSILCMILWGSVIPVIKITYGYLNVDSKDIGSQILIAGIRFFGAGIISFVYFLIFNREKINKDEIDYKFLFIISLVQITIQYTFYYIGLYNIEGIKSSIIQSSNALIIVVFSVILIKGEKFTLNKIISLIIGMLGVIVVSLKGRVSDVSFRLNAEGAILIATTANALGTVLVKKYASKQNIFIISIGQFIIGSIPLLILGIFISQANLYFNMMSILLLLYGMFVSSTAFTIWYMVISNQASSEFGIYKIFVPIFGSIASVIFLSEKFTLKLFIGMTLVLLSFIILNFKVIMTKIKK